MEKLVIALKKRKQYQLAAKVQQILTEPDIRQQLISYYTQMQTADVINAALYEEACMYLEASPLDFFKKLGKILTTPVQDLMPLFKDWRVVKFFGKIKWSFEKLHALLKQGKQYLQDLSNVIAKYVEENKIVKWTTQEIQKLDAYLHTHPNTKKIVGVAVAAILIYIWFNMAFTGDPAYDFGMEDVLSAFAGKFALVDIFGGAKGVKLLALLAAGVGGLTFPWPGPSTTQFIVGVLQTLAKKLGKKLKFL